MRRFRRLQGPRSPITLQLIVCATNTIGDLGCLQFHRAPALDGDTRRRCRTILYFIHMMLRLSKVSIAPDCMTCSGRVATTRARAVCVRRGAWATETGSNCGNLVSRCHVVTSSFADKRCRCQQVALAASQSMGGLDVRQAGQVGWCNHSSHG